MVDLLYNIIYTAASICFQDRVGKIRIRGGGGNNHGEKTFYVYLLASSILYKNTAYFGGWQNDCFARTIYYWVGNRTPAPRIDAPVYIYIYILMFNCILGDGFIHVNKFVRYKQLSCYHTEQFIRQYYGCVYNKFVCIQNSLY